MFVFIVPIQKCETPFLIPGLQTTRVGRVGLWAISLLDSPDHVDKGLLSRAVAQKSWPLRCHLGAAQDLPDLGVSCILEKGRFQAYQVPTP